jgi:hypothetical protein
MLVREEDDRHLHLFSVISPEWTKPGDVISVKRAPTDFGEVNLQARFTDAGAELHLDDKFTQRPEEVILHLPWFVDIRAITADGKRLSVANGSVNLPVNAREVRLEWHRKSDTPELSYDKAVRDYKAEYRSRYERWLRTGKN